MKTNIVTKMIWFAVCATVLLSAESLVRADEPPTRSAKAAQAAR